MIRSFKDRKTQLFFEGHKVRKSRSFAGRASRRLDVLDSAAVLQDLSLLRSNRLESLSGDRAGQSSIRINKQCRVCFCWGDDGPYNVEIVDYY